MLKQKLIFIFFFLYVSLFSAFAQTSTVLIDFGSVLSDAPWINCTNPSDAALENLQDSLGVSTGINLTVFDSFNGINTSGTQNPAPSLGIPGSASGDSFYGNTSSFAGKIEPTGGIRLSNLDTLKMYTLKIFASREASDNRETQYICTGAQQDTAYLNVAGNTDSIVTFSVYPSKEGTIEIVASPGPNNNNSYGFYYLGAMIIKFQSDSIPLASLQLIRPNGGEVLLAGQNTSIEWESTTQSPVTVEYSIDNGGNWNLIGTFPAYQKSYDWLVPNISSNQCLVRVTSDTLMDQSDDVFEIKSTEMRTVLIDFGSIPSEAPWINCANPNNAVLQNLQNSLGAPSGINLEVFDSFNGINTSGTQSPSPSLGIPGSASGDSFFGNTATFSGKIEPTGGIRLSNLDTLKMYTLKIFASREASDNRETQYICTGAQQDTAYLNVAGNTDSIVTFSVYPSKEGTIEIVASPGPNNNNSYGFYYLGALIINYPADSNTEKQLRLVRPNGGEFWQVGKTVKIEWENTTQSEVDLALSIDNGTHWTTLKSFPPYQKSYDWTVLNVPSKQCLMRISADSLFDKSDSVFEISSESGSCPVVVIGSSTAEGVGASTPDSAWVNRFRNAAMNDTRHEVINLAKGGYTTYHLLPTGSTAGQSVGIAVDTERNITKALSFNPVAVIINLPSNDAARYFPVNDQLANFNAMVSEAAAHDVPVWVCTPQPRNFTDSKQIQIQIDLRDSIFAIYGDYAIDFWNGLAQPNGFIIEEYNSGDGVHLNDKGHLLLFQRVSEKVIWDSLCVNTTSIDESGLLPKDFKVNLYPNPFNPSTTVSFNLPVAGQVEIKIFNILGQNVKTLVKKDFFPGNHKVVWDGTDQFERMVTSGVYFFQIKSGKYSKFIKGLFIK